MEINMAKNNNYDMKFTMMITLMAIYWWQPLT